MIIYLNDEYVTETRKLFSGMCVSSTNHHMEHYISDTFNVNKSFVFLISIDDLAPWIMDMDSLRSTYLQLESTSFLGLVE